MKHISVMVPKEGEGQIVNGAIVGKTARTTAYQLNDGTILFDRDEAREVERLRDFSTAIHEALELNLVGRLLSARDVVSIMLNHETKLRNIMAAKKFRKARIAA